MQIEEFINIVEQKLTKRLNHGEKLIVDSCLKNNGVHLTGLQLLRQDEIASPVVYMEPFYKSYLDDNSKEDYIIDSIYRILMESSGRIVGQRAIERFGKWKNAKKYVYAKIINRVWNKELLQNVPHRNMMDLSIVYYVRVTDLDNEQLGSIMINNQHISIWGVDESELYDSAVKNLESDGAKIVNITDILGDKIKKQKPDGFKMYIVTNSSKIFGASELLNKSALRQVADMFNDNVTIIPSSINELIVIPCSWMNCSEIVEAVEFINGNFVKQEEVLSNHVYIYDRNDEVVSIAA